MEYYILYGEFQKHLRNYYYETGNMLEFTEMVKKLYSENLLSTECSQTNYNVDFESMTDDEFNKFVDETYITLKTPFNSRETQLVKEHDLIPNKKDIFVIRHPQYALNNIHEHNYFEINYIVSGSASFYFENELHELKAGEICIIAPNSSHNILITSDSFAFTICIRKSTFDTTFFSLMSRKDLLSYFFRTVLHDSSHKNYLLFYTNQNKLLKNHIRRLMVESTKNDIYSNSCCISYTNLFFTDLLRNYSDTVKFYSYKLDSDFSLLLRYIQNNYKTITLDSISDFFSYSKPYLSTLIKQNTGFNFTELVRRMRLADAVDYLSNSDLKVSEISDLVGYNSADHFSRTFKAVYNMSPNEYRKLNSTKEVKFRPFSVIEKDI